MAADDRTEELRLLRAIARWTREAALPTVRARVERLLDSEARKRVYEAIEAGNAGIVAVERTTGVNHNNIGLWIKAWEAEGIVDRGSSPPKASFSLAELGISPAPPKVRRARKGEAQ